MEINPKKTALIVQCMQNDFVKSKTGNVSGLQKMVDDKKVVYKIKMLVDQARKTGIPVIFVAHVKREDGADVKHTASDSGIHVKFVTENTSGADFIDELKPTEKDHVVYKRRGSSFYNTDLDLRLRCLGVNTLIFTGTQTDVSLANTIMDAHNRDFDVIVVSDCCAAKLPEDDEYFMTRRFPQMGQVRTASEILAAIE